MELKRVSPEEAKKVLLKIISLIDTNLDDIEKIYMNAVVRQTTKLEHDEEYARDGDVFIYWDEFTKHSVELAIRFKKGDLYEVT